jgi:flagellar basal body rod protein FlgF
MAKLSPEMLQKTIRKNVNANYSSSGFGANFAASRALTKGIQHGHMLKMHLLEAAHENDRRLQTN